MNVSAVILAGGRGTRLNATTKNKVVYELGEKPMIKYSVENLKNSGISNIIVVIGYAGQSVKKVLGESVAYAVQEKPLGTADALKAAIPKIPLQTQNVICVYGDDSAFYSPTLIKHIISQHQKHHAKVSLLTLIKKDPSGLGRILRDSDGKISGIVEEKNATKKQRQIHEINTGLYCFDKEFLINSMPKISKNKISNEYYLTDIIEIAVKSNQYVHGVLWDDNSVWFGVNDPEQLKEARRRMKR